MIGVLVLFLILGALLLPALVAQIFFLITLARALGRCRPHNRTMEPGHVWFNLIPLFNTVWIFITVLKLSESLRFEFRDRGEHRRDEEYGKGLGIAMCIAPLAGGLPVWLVLWIMYWVKIAEFARRLERGPLWDDYEDYDDEDDYDAPRSRRRRRDRDEEEDDRRDDRRPERPWDRGGR